MEARLSYPIGNRADCGYGDLRVQKGSVNMNYSHYSKNLS